MQPIVIHNSVLRQPKHCLQDLKKKNCLSFVIREEKADIIYKFIGVFEKYIFFENLGIIEIVPHYDHVPCSKMH